MQLRCALRVVIGDEILETERPAGVLHYPADNLLTAYRAEIRDVVVHTAVVLRTPDSPAVHVAALVNVDETAVFLVVEQVTPRHVLRLSAQGQVHEPTFRLGGVELLDVAAAAAVASVDEGIVVDVLVAELAESVTAGLVLDDASEILGITVVALRAIGYRRAVVPETGRPAIFRSVRDYDYERPGKIVLIHGRHPAGIAENFGIIAVPVTPAESDTALRRGVETVVHNRVYASDSGLG